MNAPATLAELATRADAGEQGRALPHESAWLHVTGEATYTDDIPELRGTVYAALVLSPVACGELVGEGIDRAALLAQHGVVAVFTARDIPGENNCGPIVHDDPFLADGTVRYLGQPVAVVVAREMLYAREAAARAVVQVREQPAILTIDQALQAGSFVLPTKTLQRGDVDAALAAAPRRLAGSAQCGQQEQFYLEGQITYAVPREDGQLTLFCSTQHPDGNQREAAAALELGTHDVEVICRRMGGGFGGKEGQASIFSQSAALAAHKLRRPVKLRVGRDDDMLITGKRHDFRLDYDVGFDDDGRILALDVVMASRCGHSVDFSGPVNDRAVLHIDNCYHLPHMRVVSHRCRTNTQSSTAFRGFGGPQGMLGIETVIEEIARTLGRDPLEVRRLNLYRSPAESGHPLSMTTPYGQVIEDFIAPAVLDELAQRSGWAERRAQVRAHNAVNPVRKRGLALAPLKFGISFTATMLNQAGALVLVYQDGSVVVNHGGTEMGQGLNTKMAQVAADGLGVPLARVRVTGTDTQKVPNASATAASSGSDLNGAAIANACAQLRERLAAVAAPLLGCEAAQVRFAGDAVHDGHGHSLPWTKVVTQAWLDRVSLAATGYYRTPEIGYDFATLSGQAFYYFCYGAAVTEVEVDTLTGEWWCRRVDIVHDVGRSLNPAIDRGQIEGAYVQGLGWLTMEECIWDARGRLLTHGPSTYKIPVAGDIPAEFHVHLHDGENVKPTPYRSKAVGEPPLMLALSGLFALQDAVAACGRPGQRVQLDAPATPERILLACERARRG
ncbi:MAG: xanthine dehydrogenase molybdopterin binding subunit [Aquabacterium sp.]|nr:xanthine dehydrogenase molybdopterin binding subunit [Aquabacterium sp.]